MSATILHFPMAATGDSLRRRTPSQGAAFARKTSDSQSGGHRPFTPAWCEQHLPLIDAAMDLLSADDAEFARRCALMADEEGRAMLGELAGQLERLGSHVADVGDALELTAERIRAAVSVGIAEPPSLGA